MDEGLSPKRKFDSKSVCPDTLPPALPPITLSTLRPLEVDSIIQNVQLRHDILFDPSLHFRPTPSSSTESYWNALSTELASPTHCTCVSFSASGAPRPLQCACLRVPHPPDDALLVCSPVDNVMTLRMPSRVRSLLDHLLDVLLSVVCNDRNSVDANYVRSLIDPSFITQQLRLAPHLFDALSLFKAIGQLLKKQCAPMRDRMVDKMVSKAEQSTIDALRMCFELLEVMKLDIANHQLQALRPILIAKAPHFERKLFLASKGLTDPNINPAPQTLHPYIPLTCAWLASSIAECSRSVYQAAVRGIVHLIFYPPLHFPESFYLDMARLRAMAHEVCDLVALCAWLLLARIVGVPVEEMSKLKKEIIVIRKTKGDDEDVLLQVVRRSSSANIEIARQWAKANVYRYPSVGKSSHLRQLLDQRMEDAILKHISHIPQSTCSTPPLREPLLLPPEVIPDVTSIGSKIAKFVQVHLEVCEWIAVYESLNLERNERLA